VVALALFSVRVPSMGMSRPDSRLHTRRDLRIDVTATAPGIQVSAGTVACVAR
jgi:hypothetical protein